MSAQLVLPGDNPDVSNLVMEHENGAISNLTASYASASEYYMMNIYGKQASAFYNWFDGLRYFERGKDQPVVVPCEENDEIAEELVEFADCIRGDRVPEMGGEGAIKSLAVIRAGVLSVEEGRRVEVVEVL
jgi:predicted dehydrogenase